MSTAEIDANAATGRKKGRISYEELLSTNNLIRLAGEETYFLGVTRTVQESKFFPVSAYILLSYINAFYRYPALLRKIAGYRSPEELADRVRHVASRATGLGINWCMTNFYLLGREILISMGVVRPQDAVEDVAYVMGFWRRFQLAWRREDGHITCKEGGHRAQTLPERRVQVFHADLYHCEPGDRLHEATDRFLAAVSQYAVLVSCESRICMTNHGPYNIGGGRELLVRDFCDLAEGDMQWLDEIGAEVPYARLTITTAVRDTHFYVVDDWGSFESKPEYKSDKICGVGLYTSDEFTETHVPVGMDSRESLTRTLNGLADLFAAVTTKLWQRFAGYDRNQLMDCGAITYYSVIKEFAHLAGCFSPSDWFTIDPRAERFRGILNDEYSNQMMGSLFVNLQYPSQQCAGYSMMMHSDKPTRSYSALPQSVLSDPDYVPTVGAEIQQGITHLPPKVDRYRTTRGVLGIVEMNAQIRQFVPKLCSEEFRDLDDAWVKYNAHTQRAHELYCIEQQYSRNLRGRGAKLSTADVEAINRAEGGNGKAHVPLFESPAEEAHYVLHALAVKRHASAETVAGVIGLPVARVEEKLKRAVGWGSVIEEKGKYLLTPLGRTALDFDYSRFQDALRGDAGFVDAYEAFERINVELKSLITRWQTLDVGGRQIANDHSDPAYDEKIISRLGELHERSGQIFKRLAAAAPRFTIYSGKLSTALEKAEDGDITWVSDAKIESYHTVWFELHEDLLRVMGRTRHA